jgi:hypothetical protein
LSIALRSERRFEQRFEQCFELRFEQRFEQNAAKRFEGDALSKTLCAQHALSATLGE